MSETIIKSIDNIYKINLDVKKNEKVLVLTDKKDRKLKEIAKIIAIRGINFSKNVSFISYKTTGYHGTEPPEKAWIEAYGEQALKEMKKKKLLEPIILKKATIDQLKTTEKIISKYKKDSVDVVIALAYYSTSHTSFRNMLNRICGTRYASMPLFDEKMLSGAMRVNWKRMLKRTKEISRIVNEYEKVEIECDNGTSISFSKKGRKVFSDTGIITKWGGFSNLPAGESYLAPLEGTAHGRLVLDWAPTRKLKSSVIINIENGMVSSVDGRERYVKFLRKKLAEKRQNRNVAELGIGTNDQATRPDNILESEKIFGTIHIALGDNSSFGGKVQTSFHQDFVFFSPTLTLISGKGSNRTLLKKGKLIK